jgi:hypothetical protein
MGRALNVIGVPTGAATFTAALEGLTALDEELLRQNPGLPPIAQAGVVYDKEPTSKWRTVLDILDGKSGPKMRADCEALAPWRAAELRVSGEDPGAHALVYPSGPSKFHAIVMRSDGTLEDPSVELGMQPPAGLLDGYDWWNSQVAPRLADESPRPDVAVMGADDLDWDEVACVGIDADPEPGNPCVTFDLVRTDGGFKGQFRCPFLDGRALFGRSSLSSTADEAERKAAAVLGFVGSFWDDVTALAPPQAAAAIRIARNQHVQNIAKAAYGKAKSLTHKGSGGGRGAPNANQNQYQVIRDDQGNALQLVDQDGNVVRDFAAEQGAAVSPDADPMTDSFFSQPPGGADVNGVVDENAVIGWINAALVSGSRPKRGGSRGGSRGGGSRGRGQQRGGGGQRGGGRSPGQPRMQASAGGGYSPSAAYGGGYGGSPAYGGGGYGGGAGAGSGFGGGRGQGFGGGALGRQGMDPRQRQQQQQQQQGGGGGDSGGGSSGGGGGDSGGGSGDWGGGGGDFAMDQQAPFTDPDAFFSMPGYGTLTDQDFADTAQLAQQIDEFEAPRATPEQFFTET